MKKLLCISALLALVGACFAEPVRIVAYGDSLTYGWIPNANPPSTRYGLEDRWPGALQTELGNNYQVIEEGLDGRTTRSGSRIADQRRSTRRECIPSRMSGGASAAVWPIVFSTGVYKFARQTMTTVVKCKFFNPPLFTYRM
jgi:hypothetical protein